MCSKTYRDGDELSNLAMRSLTQAALYLAYGHLNIAVHHIIVSFRVYSVRINPAWTYAEQLCVRLGAASLPPT